VAAAETIEDLRDQLARSEAANVALRREGQGKFDDRQHLIAELAAARRAAAVVGVTVPVARTPPCATTTSGQGGVAGASPRVAAAYRSPK